ncbi:MULTISPECIES: mechanosensitive ion channel family protein [Marinobacter]|jgi:small-conductance mechanosensitive channel|uniref:Mechanosensitive ion channel family protein n=1 Tax=Marinobacter metalliresistant TaxID=2961995 RepID=A0ABZ2W684_9GAMM|nr:mechanosensitive ion channel domain-containing protein [Marinobacter sp. SS8-8]MAZ06445.1 mechanosensitive ion channel protein MscS [Halomonas sp.]|tara:strand:+ start:17692 stop:18741 length:1050 start_codon:yes stop_codon:yes gene_type:complete
MLEAFEAGFKAWMWPGFSAILAVAATYVVYRLALAVFRHFSEPGTVLRLFLDAAARALGVVFCLLVLAGALEAAPADLPLMAAMQQVTTLLLVLAITWAAVRLTSAIGEVIVALNPVLEGQWKRARKVETQTRFLVRALNILIVIIGLGAALMTFESVQHMGASLLASAGVGGLILGFAARPVLSNLLAGMQIALTQPFRIDDVLNVQGEWCWVEEVTSTYVVLRVWDLRRLVIPLQWFIENPFQNWSRNTADLLGTVFIWVDYTMPVKALRQEFNRLLAQSGLWDGKVATVQVTDASDQAMQVRFLMSASDSSRNWDLRCAVREGLVTFIQENYPAQLPRLRARMVES